MGGERNVWGQALDMYARTPRLVAVGAIAAATALELAALYQLSGIGADTLAPRPESQEGNPTLTVAPYVPPQDDPALTLPTQPFQSFEVPNNQALVDQINAQIQEATTHAPATFTPQGQYPYPSPTPKMASQLALYPRPGDNVCNYSTAREEILAYDINRNPYILNGADYVTGVEYDQYGATFVGYRKDGSPITLRTFGGETFQKINCP